MEIINFNPEQESEEQYIYRICSMKETSGMTWQQIADIINAALNHNFGESAYRKRYQMFQQGLKACESQIFTDDEYLKKIQAEKDELYKVKKQFQDQRREYNKLLASDARAEHLTEKLIEAAENLNKNKFLSTNQNLSITSNNEAVLVLTDWHFGMVTDNIWNKYNTEICVERVNILFQKTSMYLRQHNIKTLHIVLLGDFIHGAIHTSARVASEEDTCDQLMKVSEILAELINGLSQSTNNVYVYSTYGNHARTVQNKNDSIHSDNMEKVIPWWIKHRLSANPKVHVVDNVFRLAAEVFAQRRVLSSNAHGAGIQIAHTHHHAANGNQGRGGKAVLLCTQQGGDDNVTTGEQLAISFQCYAVTQVVQEQCLVGFHQAQLPGETGMVDRGARGRTGTTVVAANEHNVGAGLNYACSNGTNAHLANQLHADAGTGVGVLQIVNQLGQVLDGVYIMMGRR